jgi:hypothetical protein
VAAFGVLVSAEPGGARLAPSCRSPVADAPQGLPATVVLTTSCGRYEVARAGRVRFLGGRRLPVPAGSSWFDDLTWYRIKHGHLVVGRRHRQLWHSHKRFAVSRAGDQGVGAIALSRTRVAFSFFAGTTPMLFLARLGGEEERVAGGETPLGWTRAGSLLTLGGGGAIRVRSANGQLERVLAHRTDNFVFDRASGALLYLVHGTIERFDGHRIRTLARLPALRLGGRPSLTPRSGVVVVSGSERLVVLGSDGALLSSTMLPRPRAHADWAPGALAADGRGDVAHTATDGNTGYGSSGTETVYLLPAGASAARAVFQERVDFAVCERQAELTWREDWLLYSASEGYAAAINTSQPGQFVELSPLVPRLPRLTTTSDDVFDASWATSERRPSPGSGGLSGKLSRAPGSTSHRA